MSSEAGLRAQDRKGFRQMKEHVQSDVKLMMTNPEAYVLKTFANLTKAIRSGRLRMTEEQWRQILKDYAESGKLPEEKEAPKAQDSHVLNEPSNDQSKISD